MFDKMSKEEYRKLDNESFEARCATVLAELNNKESEVAVEDLIAEKDMIVEERKLRDSEVQIRKAMVKEVNKGAGEIIERSAKTVKEEKVMPENINETEAYTRAFYEFATAGKEIPVELRTSQNALTGDRSAVIPTTIMSRIIEKIETYGELYAKVTKTNIKGGVEYPILDLNPTAKWVAENAASEAQKVTSTKTVSFKYHELECVISQSRLASIVTFDEFQAKFPDIIARAMAKSIDKAIMGGSGNGEPEGIIQANGTMVVMDEDEINSWEAWHKNVKAKMGKSYRNGEFIMAQSTFDSYIDGMTDKNGQPIARTNYGIDGAENYRFMGKNVIIVEDDVIPGFDDVSIGGCFAVFVDLKNYAINTNQQLQMNKWTDFDNRTEKMGAYMVLDGKMIDKNGLITVRKKQAKKKAEKAEVAKSA